MGQDRVKYVDMSGRSAELYNIQRCEIERIVGTLTGKFRITHNQVCADQNFEDADENNEFVPYFIFFNI